MTVTPGYTRLSGGPEVQTQLLLVGGVMAGFAGVAASRIADARGTLGWGDAPVATIFPGQRPPPLSLPEDVPCTQQRAALAAPPGGVEATWTEAAVRAHLDAHTRGSVTVSLVDVDCTTSPCIAWLLWEEGIDDPALAFRWWSLEGLPSTALWTASRTWPVEAEGPSTSALQAVSIAPPRAAPDLAPDARNHLDARIAAQLGEMRSRVGRRPGTQSATP